MHYFKNSEKIDQHIVSIEDRAFLYGDGCFTTARIKGRQVLLWQRHLARLLQGITALCLQCDIERINHAKEIALAALAEHETAILKIVISRGSAARGYAMPLQAVDIYCYLYPVEEQHVAPTSLACVGLISNSLSHTFLPLKGIKTLNRLEQVLLKNQAVQQGWSEAFCVDGQRHLVEGISSNCFVYLDGVWCSPNLQYAGIDGIMRQEILARMHHYAIPHDVRVIDETELEHSQAGFFCNALSPMQIIQTVQLGQEKKRWDSAPCLDLFQSLSLQQLV